MLQQVQHFAHRLAIIIGRGRLGGTRGGCRSTGGFLKELFPHRGRLAIGPPATFAASGIAIGGLGWRRRVSSNIAVAEIERVLDC